MATNSMPRPRAESVLNVPLAPDTRRGLERVSLYNSRTLRRQAALYIDRAVRRDIQRMERQIGR